MADDLLAQRPVSEIAASEIVEAIPSALIILDRNLNITSANRAFYQTFRTSPGAHDGSILLAIEDVSEERAARVESNATWRLTQSIVDTIRDPLVVLEDDMTIVTASKAFLTMFGITAAATRGRGAFAITIVGRDTG